MVSSKQFQEELESRIGRSISNFGLKYKNRCLTLTGEAKSFYHKAIVSTVAQDLFQSGTKIVNQIRVSNQEIKK